MSFASTLGRETPQTVWRTQEALGARLMLAIPFGARVDDMLGFISVMGDKDLGLPVLTLCVDRPTGGAIVSTVVFDSTDRYTDFVSRLLVDSAMKFEVAALD